MNARIGYRSAVARQPESLADARAAVAQALGALDLSGFAGRRVGLAGIGASYQAALIGASYLRGCGLPAYAFCPTDLYTAPRSAAEAFVALSASGQSREISDVMALVPELPRIAVCRSAGTPLGRLTGMELSYNSGADNGASSTGYTGMVLALGLLADRLSGTTDDAAWRRLPEQAATVIDGQAGRAAAAAELLAGRVGIDTVGAGAAFATAGEAAMLIREAVRIPAAGWDTLNYLHGPMESQDPRTGLIALGDGREVKIAQDVAAYGCPSVLITSRSDVADAENLVVLRVPETLNRLAGGILDIIAAQIVVGEMQDAAGLTDITFRYRQTDTKLKPWSPSEV